MTDWVRRAGNLLLGVLSGVLSMLALLGCSLPENKKSVEFRETQIQRDQSIIHLLEQRFSGAKKTKDDSKLKQYFERLSFGIASKILPSGPHEVKVILLDDKMDKGPNWLTKGFGVSGSKESAKIYISASLIKNLNFENELASIISFELASIQRGFLLKTLKKKYERDLAAAARTAKPGDKKILESALDPNTEEENEDTNGVPLAGKFLLDTLSDEKLGSVIANISVSGKEGIFDLSLRDFREIRKVIGRAVNGLYQAGFDPRGLTTIWNLYSEHTETSPYDSALLSELIESTRIAIMRTAPLRNPIVRSKEFLEIKDRLHQL